MNEIPLSILLGSGFSVPEGLPTVSDINEKLSTLKKDDFYIMSTQAAGFYTSNYKDPNDWSSFTDRQFAEEFTTYYCTNVIGERSKFNYEVFYDYMSDFLRYKKDEFNIGTFCDEFRKLVNDESDNHNLVWRFSKVFSQLVADLLYKPKHFEDVSYLNYPAYDPFFGFLSEILKERIVNVHTLNHDIFFDHMASKYSQLWQFYTDGFSEYGSPYYGEISIDHTGSDYTIHKTYNVRLKYFTGDYDNKLRLFKLHGSIDNCILHTNHEEVIRVKRGIGVRNFHVEKFNKTSKKYEYETPFARNEPDYLTGTTEKVRQYKQPFYENLFSHFTKNLLNCDELLIIGYGFQDRAINEFIENNFLIYNKTMIVFDVKKPVCHLFDKYRDQIVFSDKGVQGISLPQFIKWFSK